MLARKPHIDANAYGGYGIRPYGVGKVVSLTIVGADTLSARGSMQASTPTGDGSLEIVEYKGSLVQRELSADRLTEGL